MYSLRDTQQSGVSVTVVGTTGRLGLHVQGNVMEGAKKDHGKFGLQTYMDVPSLKTVLPLIWDGNIATVMKFVTMEEHTNTTVDAHPGGKVHVVTKK